MKLVNTSWCLAWLLAMWNVWIAYLSCYTSLIKYTVKINRAMSLQATPETQP